MATQDISTAIYGGDHTVVFKHKSHRYRIDGDPKQGVTTIINKVLAKPDLMLWPLNMAMKHIREWVDKNELFDARDLEELLDEAAKAHTKRRDDGANTGTIVHELVERLLADPTLLTEDIGKDQPPEVQKAVRGFQEWHKTAKPTTIAVEQVVYSPTMDYAGTFDSVLRLDGRNYLCDLKTTNLSREAPQGVYAEYFVQLGAYLAAYNEQREYENEKYGKTELVSIHDLLILSCKKNGRVDVVRASDLGLEPEDCIDLWRHTHALFKTITNVKTKLKEGVTS